MTRRVVVTGGSCISALGCEVDEVFDSLRKLENKVVRMDDWDRYAQMNTRLASPVNFEVPDLPRKKIRGMGRVALLATASAVRALKDSGLDQDPAFLQSGRVGVAYGGLKVPDEGIGLFGQLRVGRIHGVVEVLFDNGLFLGLVGFLNVGLRVFVAGTEVHCEQG